MNVLRLVLEWMADVISSRSKGSFEFRFGLLSFSLISVTGSVHFYFFFFFIWFFDSGISSTILVSSSWFFSNSWTFLSSSNKSRMSYMTKLLLFWSGHLEAYIINSTVICMLDLTSSTTSTAVCWLMLEIKILMFFKLLQFTMSMSDFEIRIVVFKNWTMLRLYATSDLLSLFLS